MNIFDEQPIVLEVYDGWNLGISKRYIFQRKRTTKKKGGEDDEFEEFDIMNVEEPQTKQKLLPKPQSETQQEPNKEPTTTPPQKTEVINVENNIFLENIIV